MNPNENSNTSDAMTPEAKLRFIQQAITDRLFEAMADPKQKLRASLVTAATTWLRLQGTLDDPQANRFRTPQNSASVLGAFAADLPFLSEDERRELRETAAEESARRERQANAIGAALDSLAGEDGTDGDDE